MNRSLVGGTRKPNSTEERSIAIQELDTSRAARAYSLLVEEYRKGSRDSALLRQLSLMALEAGDEAFAVEVGNQFLDRQQLPYSEDVWKFVKAAVNSSSSRGFSMLRNRAIEADAVLGSNAAETVVRKVIRREEIDPYISTHNSPLDWGSMGDHVARKYGPLGAEAVNGVAMIYFLAHQEWDDFAKYYKLYFATAASRTEYPIGPLSYVLFQHVGDMAAIEAAIRSCKYIVDPLEVRGPADPVDVDTYANLLYKAGRESEAMEWEELAGRLGDGRNQVIIEHLDRMRAGKPTWVATR
jgi:hypothetical protein